MAGRAGETSMRRRSHAGFQSGNPKELRFDKGVGAKLRFFPAFAVEMGGEVRGALPRLPLAGPPGFLNQDEEGFSRCGGEGSVAA